MPDMIVTHRLTKYYDRRRAVDALDLRVPRGRSTASWDATGPANRPPSRCSWAWSTRTTAGRKCSAKTPCSSGPKPGPGSPIWPKATRLYRWMTIGEAVALHPRVLSQLERPPAGADPRSFRAFAAGQDSPALPRPAGPGLAGPGRGRRSGAADPRRPDAGPGHGRPPRFPGIADPDHPAPRPHDPLQLAHPGRRGAGGRPHRHPGRRRAAGGLPDRPFQGIGPQGGVGVRSARRRNSPPARAWSATGKSAASGS